MTDKEKIIAYIDKLLEKYPKNYYLLMIAEFIDSLQEEPVSEDSEKENKIEILANIIFNAAKHGYMPYDTQDEYCAMEIAKNNIDKFIIPKKQKEPVSEDLDKAAEEWDESLYRSDAFKAGAKWHKEQMMAKAVNGVCSLELGDIGAVRTLDNFKLNGLHCGDKVKLIIIKDE